MCSVAMFFEMRQKDFDRSPSFRYETTCLLARDITFTIKAALRHYTRDTISSRVVYRSNHNALAIPDFKIIFTPEGTLPILECTMTSQLSVLYHPPSSFLLPCITTNDTSVTNIAQGYDVTSRSTLILHIMV